MHVKRIDVNYIGEVSRIINFRRIKREAKMMSYDIPFEIEYGGFIYVRVWIWLCLSRDDGVHVSDGVCVDSMCMYIYILLSFPGLHSQRHHLKLSTSHVLQPAFLSPSLQPPRRNKIKTHFTEGKNLT